MKTILAIVASALFLGVPYPSFGNEHLTDEINALLAEEKRDLEILKLKIKKRGRKLSSVRAEERSVLGTLDQLKHNVKLKERELQIYKWNIKINKRKLEKLQRSVSRMESLLTKRKDDLGRWLRVLYKEGSLFPVKVLFSSKDTADLLQRIKFMDIVADYDARLFYDYGSQLRQLLKEKETLLQVRSNLELLQKDAEIRRNGFEKEKYKHQAFLNRLKKEKRLGIRLRKELVEASRNLDNIISEQKKRIDEGKILNINDHKGRLNYPAKGKILSRFGKKRDSRYDSYVVHNGITLKTRQKTAVKAVYSGRVLYTGLLEGYGNLIILGHGNDYHSVYGHLEKFYVKAGQVVGKDQIIGYSGNSGPTISNSLYFELRKNGKAIDPSSWFRFGKK